MATLTPWTSSTTSSASPASRCRPATSWSNPSATPSCWRARDPARPSPPSPGCGNGAARHPGFFFPAPARITAREVARQDGVTHMPAPHRKALARAFFELAAAHRGPPRITGEHPAAGFDLVVEVHRPGQLAQPSEHMHLPLEPPRVDVLAVTGDVPSAGEHQPRTWWRRVEHRLGRPRRVPVDTAGDQHTRSPLHRDPSTSCWASSVRARVWPPRCWSSW